MPAAHAGFGQGDEGYAVMPFRYGSYDSEDANTAGKTHGAASPANNAVRRPI